MTLVTIATCNFFSREVSNGFHQLWMPGTFCYMVKVKSFGYHFVPTPANFEASLTGLCSVVALWGWQADEAVRARTGWDRWFHCSPVNLAFYPELNGTQFVLYSMDYICQGGHSRSGNQLNSSGLPWKRHA